MKRFLWIVELSAIILITLPFLLLPSSTGRILGIVLYYLWKERREIALENVRLANASGIITGQPEEIVRRSFGELGRSIVEIVKIFYGLGNRILKRVRFMGLENLEKGKNKGRGIIFITGHCGNWEMLAIAASLKLNPVSIIARHLNNPYLNRLIEKIRSRYGNRIVYKKGALKEVIRTLRNNGSVGILMDQAVLPEEGILVDFLSRAAWTTKMPVLIARKTGSPILPVFIRRKGREHVVTIYPEVMLLSTNDKTALEKDLKILNSYIEDYIRENPEQWLWIHRRWKRTG